jgi:regulator of protease activity HflC (stomatin/prohibitin superfamily)
VPAFYVKFRTAEIDTFTHGFLRNVARDKFDSYGGRYSIEQIMGDNAEFIKSVREAVAAEVKPIGVEIDQFGLIGAPRPPAQIQKGINDKAAAQQLAQQKVNELQQANADAQKVIAKANGDAEATRIWSDAQAAANRKLSESLTPNLLELKKLEKWNGDLPYINGGSTNPFVSIEKKQ